mmetsp:Transcript_35242/g.56671  ORF Transcript_35242/g.56671 Transcript_35242/m.56671 type:complete len:103 (+) Transcript_35242:544-852(+)
MIVLGHQPLALKHFYSGALLVVLVSRENHHVFGRQRCVALDDRRHEATSGLDAQGQGSHIDESQLLAGPLDAQGSSLEGGAMRHHLVGVDTPRELLPIKELA